MRLSRHPSGGDLASKEGGREGVGHSPLRAQVGEGGTPQETAPGPGFHASSGALAAAATAAALGLKQKEYRRLLPTDLTRSFIFSRAESEGWQRTRNAR